MDAALHFSQAQLDGWITGFVLSFTRIAAMLIAAPMFGARTIPMQVRISLALVLTLMVQPILPPVAPLDLLSFQMILAVGREVLVGVMAGFVLQLVFAALAMAGETIALGMGLGFASLVDPDKGIQVPVVGQALVIIGTLLFLAMDGHLALMRFLVESFTTMPIGSGVPVESFTAIVGWGSVMFGHAVMIALPAVGALLLANLSMGVVTRAAPALNIFAVGFPMTLMLGFIMLYSTIGAIDGRFTALLSEGFSLIGWLLGG